MPARDDHGVRARGSSRKTQLARKMAKEQKSRVDRWLNRARNNPIGAVVIIFATIVIGLSTFTDAAKRLVNVIPRQGPDEARLQLSKLSPSFSPDAFVDRARVGDVAAVKLFLAAGMDPNVKDSTYQNNTALIEAVRNRQPVVTAVLLEAKANVNLKNADSYTALLWAVGTRQTEILRALLGAGATVDAINRAFVYAARYGNLEALGMLWERGVDRGATAREALVFAAQGYATDDSTANRAVQFLLGLGLDVNARAEDYTPLQRAALGGKLLVAQTLLDRGASINATCDCKAGEQAYTPLMLATIYEHKDVANLLLAKGADVNQQNAYDGRTALMFAAYRDESTVRALLERGARVRDRDRDGKTALAIAEEELKAGRARPGLVRALKEAAAK